eukprot:FR734540.1.p2 GENE.FR734540.1~~FR734540.1.p2  ORF type:complete len:110 (-),score=0.79 FR734540.1:418-747(-)
MWVCNFGPFLPRGLSLDAELLLVAVSSEVEVISDGNDPLNVVPLAEDILESAGATEGPGGGLLSEEGRIAPSHVSLLNAYQSLHGKYTGIEFRAAFLRSIAPEVVSFCV